MVSIVLLETLFSSSLLPVQFRCNLPCLCLTCCRAPTKCYIQIVVRYDYSHLHGAGQGDGDACPRWIIQANSLTMAYNTQAHPWLMLSLGHYTYIQQGFNAFVDDTNLLLVAKHNQTAIQPIQTTQKNLNYGMIY